MVADDMTGNNPVGTITERAAAERSIVDTQFVTWCDRVAEGSVRNLKPVSAVMGYAPYIPGADTTAVLHDDGQDATISFEVTKQPEESGIITMIMQLGEPSDDRATRPDARSRKERRAGRKRYRKAVKHYGKTYTLTRNQVMCYLALGLGSVLILAGLLFRAYLWVLEASGHLVH